MSEIRVRLAGPDDLEAIMEFVRRTREKFYRPPKEIGPMMRSLIFQSHEFVAIGSAWVERDGMQIVVGCAGVQRILFPWSAYAARMTFLLVESHNDLDDRIAGELMTYCRMYAARNWGANQVEGP